MDARDEAAMFGQLLPPGTQFDEKDMTLSVPLDGDEQKLAVFPAMFVVCDLCDGKGTHVNPSIDAGGLSREDVDDDPDFIDEYMSGRYDQQCNLCHGQRVVPAVDRNRTDPDLLKRYDRAVREEAQSRAERAAEQRQGW